MTHPEWAIKHRVRGTELRYIRGKYYLYRVSSIWDKNKKRARKITHEMVGRITEEEGLIPKGVKKAGKMLNISTKEYGATFVLQKINTEMIKLLQKTFPDCWQKLLTIAINRLLYQSQLKNMEFLYEESFISEQFPKLNLSKNNMTKFMKEFGSNREKHVDFLQNFVDGSEQLVFDVTHIISQSKNVGINQKGYNSQYEFDPQVNLLYMFSVDKQMPVYYRIFPGNIHGINALKLCITESGIKKSIVIGDKGFFSEKNLVLLKNSELHYILPLKRDSSYIDYKRLNSRDYEHAFDGHFFYNDRTVFFYELPINDTRKTVVFFDQRLRLDEETTYLRRIEQKYDGYSMVEYKKKQLPFGTIAMHTNMVGCSPKKIYENYKSRMEVEIVFDTYKNLLQADRTYMHTDEAFNSWMFINHIATLMYYKVFNLLKEHALLATISPKDLLMRLARITVFKIRNKWCLAEINTKSQKLFQSLDLNITYN